MHNDGKRQRGRGVAKLQEGRELLKLSRQEANAVTAQRNNVVERGLGLIIITSMKGDKLLNQCPKASMVAFWNLDQE